MTDMRSSHKPEWLKQVDSAPVFDLDADMLLRDGEYPLATVQDCAQRLRPQSGGLLRATFDPAPLARAMAASGYDCWSSQNPNGQIVLRIWRAATELQTAVGAVDPVEDNDAEERFWLEGEDLHLDVRHLPPPMPMIAILQFIDSGAHDGDLFVHTPHFPVHLLPELEERKLNWQVIEDGQNGTILRLTKEPVS